MVSFCSGDNCHLAESLVQQDPLPYVNTHSLYHCCSRFCLFVGWLVGCLTSQQHDSVSQGRICSDKFTCCHTEIEVADETLYFTQSQYTDTGLASPRADPLTPGAWQGSHWSANFEVTGMTRSRKIPSQAGFVPRIFRSVVQTYILI